MAFIIPAIAAVGTAVSGAAASVGSAVGIGSTAAAAAGGASGGILAGLTVPTSIAADIAAAPAATGLIGSSTLGYASLASTVLGGATSAIGSIKQGQAEKEAAEFNAQVAKENQQVSTANAQIAGQAGAEQAGMTSMKTRATVGAVQANQAASGIDVNSGSDVDVRSSARELGELDALTVRSNATREAYGQTVQAASYGAESQLQSYEAESAGTAGEIGAASSFLGSTGSAANNWYRYQLQGGFSS